MDDGDVNEDGNYDDWPTFFPNLDCATYDILDSVDQEFFMNHIRKGSRGTYSTGWHKFFSLCKEHKVNASFHDKISSPT